MNSRFESTPSRSPHQPDNGKHKRQKLLFVILLWSIIGVIMVYAVVRFVRSMDRRDWGLKQGSHSQAESKAAGFYIGTYIPTKRRVSLLDHSAIQVPDAWAEHCWKPELGLLLNESRTIADGYCLNIPILENEVRTAHDGYRITLRLAQESLKYSRYPGIGFDPGHKEVGFKLYLDSLPTTLTVVVEQKRKDTWSDRIIIETIQFNRQP